MIDSSRLDEVNEALRVSGARLHQMVRTFDEADLERSAYPTEWSVADVLSHVGSGAEIALHRLDEGLAGRTIPDDYAPSVWETWNAKSPADQARDVLARDQALSDRLASLTEPQRSDASFALGPLTLDLSGFLGLRLNEHVVHTWDIEVAFDTTAQLSPEGTAVIVDNLDLIGRFTAKPTGDELVVTVLTRSPARGFVIELATDAVSFASTETPGVADLTLPAEAFIRLAYGRLDSDHTGDVDGDLVTLDQLRRVFPGP